MNKGLFITATDTGVGKTVVTAGLLAVFRSFGIKALAIKPVQSGAIKRNGKLLPPDAVFYCQTLGWPEDAAATLCCYCLEPPCSPHLAAKLSGVSINIAELLHWCRQKENDNTLVLVEGAGGLAVPITKNYLMAHLARDLGYPILLVSRASLGSINHALLSVAFARQHGLSLVGLVINGLSLGQSGPIEKDNLNIIPYLTDLPLLGVLPLLLDDDLERGNCSKLLPAFRENFNWEKLFESIHYNQVKKRG
ncbi:ATP-dependent dethiobiotin synthetase BioD [Desulfotomaculum varum]